MANDTRDSDMVFQKKKIEKVKLLITSLRISVSSYKQYDLEYVVSILRGPAA